MEDAQSDADKIRMKRLAKLGGQSSSSSDQSTSQNQEQPTTPQPPSSSYTSAPKHTSATQSDENEAPTIGQQPHISISPNTPKSDDNLGIGSIARPAMTPTQTAKLGSPLKQDAYGRASSQSRPSVHESAEAWIDKTLSSLFRVTLQTDAQRDTSTRGYYYVKGVRSDLEEEGAPLAFTAANLDQAILEAATNSSEGEPLDYLLGCWKRITRTFRSSQRNDVSRLEVLKEARRLCMSYCIFAVSMPDMFGREVSETNPLAPYLLKQADSDKGICHEFLAEAVSRFDEDETVKDALVGAIEQSSRDLAKLSMNADYQPYILALRNFCRFPPLIVAMTQSPMFAPSDVGALDFELESLLGPFFRLSPMQADVALNYFSNAGTRNKTYIANSQNALRMTLKTLQEELFDISHNFVKVKDARDRMLDWFALTVNLNHKRRAMQAKPEDISTDGFMVNVTAILDRLCEPFMDATFSKVDRIDVNYLRRNPRISIQDETKINADQNTSDEFYATAVEGTNNFISEIFFLTVAAHHYGTESANNRLERLHSDVKYLEKHIAKFELERHKFANSPRQLQYFETHLKKYKDQLEKAQCTIHATEGVLLDELNQARSMQLMRYLIVFLLRLVWPGSNYPREQLVLPLPEDQPLVFRCLPEYFVEDIVDNFKFITRTMPQILTSTQCEELVTISVTFLRSTEYIKNPYLKSGLVTILSYGVWPFYGRSKGVFGDLLYGSDFCNKHLLHALMRFHIECESTGGHTQFWDKFSIRSEIFRVIKCIWPNPVYREKLATEAGTNLEFFVRFVNMVLNDSTFVLDELFSSFIKIHELQKLLNNQAEDLNAEQRQEKEEALADVKGRAKSFMGMTKESIAMLKLFTEALAETFTMPEVVQRLADMLDYNLDALVSKKQSNLKVENPQEYGWDPAFILSEIVDVYLNLSRQPRFHTAVARDGRSYRPENFGKAAYILQRRLTKSNEQLEQWETLAVAVAAAKALDDQEELDYGEPPDDFLDPLMYTLMEDPVVLPKSRVTIDRATIRSHLLSDPNDPFNRSPLKIEEVIPDNDMKAKIDAWKEERRAAALAASTAATVGAGGAPMDTTAG